MKTLDWLYEQDSIREGGLFPVAFPAYALTVLVCAIAREIVVLYGFAPPVINERPLMTVAVVIPVIGLLAIMVIDSRRGYGNRD